MVCFWPQLKSLLQLLRAVFEKNEFALDYIYDWTKKQSGSTTPIPKNQEALPEVKLPDPYSIQCSPALVVRYSPLANPPPSTTTAKAPAEHFFYRIVRVNRSHRVETRQRGRSARSRRSESSCFISRYVPSCSLQPPLLNFLLLLPLTLLIAETSKSPLVLLGKTWSRL